MKRIGSEAMQSLARIIDKEVSGNGFALLVFPFGNEKMSNYVSNAQREDMIKALRETADRLENKQDFMTPNSN